MSKRKPAARSWLRPWADRGQGLFLFLFSITVMVCQTVYLATTDQIGGWFWFGAVIWWVTMALAMLGTQYLGYRWGVQDTKQRFLDALALVRNAPGGEMRFNVDSDGDISPVDPEDPVE